MQWKKIEPFLRNLLFFGTSVLVVTALLYRFGNEEVKNFLLYFPNYNPFSHHSYTSVDPSLVPRVLDQYSAGKLKDRFIQTSLSFTSTEKRNIIVHLPPSYDGAKTYKMVVMLHGSPGKETAWIEAGGFQQTVEKLNEEGKFLDTIFVFPDGNGGSDTQFINSKDGKNPNEDFIRYTVIKYMRDHFSISQNPQDISIGGLSSGAFGSLNIGLKNQDIFGNILAFSGYMDIEKNPQSQQFIQNDSQIIAENSLSQYVPNLTKNTIKVLLIVGKEDIFYADNQTLYAMLTDKKFAVTFYELKGIHNWVFWKENLGKGLNWLFENQTKK